jgi:hypothetical protein
MVTFAPSFTFTQPQEVLISTSEALVCIDAEPEVEELNSTFCVEPLDLTSIVYF